MHKRVQNVHKKRALRSIVVLVLVWAAVTTAQGQEDRALTLIEAVKRADTSSARDLLTQGVNENASETDGTTALHWAVQRDDLETATLLMSAGADANAANRYGVTPLELACVNANAAMVRALLEAGADANTASAEGQSALMIAARTGRTEVVELLLARGAQANAKELWKETTALMWAAAEGHTGVARVLLENGAVLGARSAKGFTPFLFAVLEGQQETADVLLGAGADISDTLPDGTSALSLAVVNAHYELANRLLEKGIDPNTADPRGSALHTLAWLRRPGRHYVMSYAQPVPTGQLSSLDLARSLLAHGANPNVRVAWEESKKTGFMLNEVDNPKDVLIGRTYLAYRGATPYFLAAKHGDVELMRLLLVHGADPLIPTADNVTPLMAAAGLGFWQGESPGPNNGVPETDTLEAVKLAYEQDPRLDTRVDYGDAHAEGDGPTLRYRGALNREQNPDRGDLRWEGCSVIHGAAVRGANSVVEFLVEKGARLDDECVLGWTPLMMTNMYVGVTETEQPHTAVLIRELLGLPAEETFTEIFDVPTGNKAIDGNPAVDDSP